MLQKATNNDQIPGASVRAAGPRVVLACVLLACCPRALALNPSLEISQYAHTAWTVRDGFSLGNIYAMAQTPDGYLWLGTEFGLVRFDGVRFIPWQPPAGQHLPDQNINALLGAHNGTLWIGTFDGLATWSGGKLTRRPELDGRFVESLLEDREGTVWVGALFGPTAGPNGLLCAMQSGSTQCYGEDGSFGVAVPGLYEDSSGTLWVLAASGLWRWKPGPAKRYATTPREVSALSVGDGGRLLIGVHGAGLMQLAGDKVESFPIRGAINQNGLFRDQDINSNKLLRDRDGGLWIGTVERGLIHVHHGRTDVFTRTEGLSGNIVLSLFEDREGNIWVATTEGLDRFRESPVTTVSAKQGLSSDASQSVLAATDGSIWVGAHDGLTRWKNGQITTFRKASGLPDDEPQSLFQDDGGRVWVFTAHGLAYFQNGRFVAIDAVRGGQVHFIAGDKAGNLWLSEAQSLLHLLKGRLVEQIPWSELERHESAEVLLSSGEQGGVWLGFWTGGGVSYVKDGQVRASYSAPDGLGEGHVAGLQLDRDGALWVATQDGGLSRIKNGHIATLTSRNGLPCDMVHWSIEDDDRALWLYTGCGLVRITRTELDAWIADPKRRIETTVWDATDGVRLRSSAASTYGPRVAKSADGKLWFVTGEGVQVVDPHNLAANKLPPPVRIEQITADRKTYGAAQGCHLPPRAHDVAIDYTALSFAAPEKVRFRYKLEGYDNDWQEAGNRRQAFYTNLPPRNYRFQVMACNNSGVWNEEGALLDFSIDPAFSQTNWFRLACLALFMALLWAVYRLRVRQLQQQERKLREVIETIPTFAWTARPDGSVDFINRHWQDYTGLSAAETAGSRWQGAVHPDDLERYVEQWGESLDTGKPFESEVRFRRADGEYRWFLAHAVPLRDARRKVLKWYGTSTDIEERKRAEEERERLRQLEGELAHTNRVSMLGELTASLAHEINQPITAAITSAGACLRWLNRDQPEVQRAREAVMRIENDGKRAAEIITHLKSFYKKDAAPQREQLAVNEVAREMIALLSNEADRHSVSMRAALAPDLPAIKAGRVPLQQVFMNLMLNAIESMRGSPGELGIKSEQRDGQILVSVSDTGAGLPPGRTEELFNAFFSTKQHGTGMGLAISRSIIESHGGRLWAVANQGRGATFHFTLPIQPETQK